MRTATSLLDVFSMSVNAHLAQMRCNMNASRIVAAPNSTRENPRSGNVSCSMAAAAITVTLCLKESKNGYAIVFSALRDAYAAYIRDLVGGPRLGTQVNGLIGVILC